MCAGDIHRGRRLRLRGDVCSMVSQFRNSARRFGLNNALLRLGDVMFKADDLLKESDFRNSAVNSIV